jgi:hypothetical protein
MIVGHEQGMELGNIMMFRHRFFQDGRMKVEIYSNEHAPPHFHVTYGGKSGSFSLRDCALVKGGENMRKERKSIEVWHSRNKMKLIEFWNDTRPDNCPVGLYFE